VDTARFDGSRREEVRLWPVKEADDGEDPPIPYFIATEARFGAHTYEPRGVILSRDEGVWVWDAQGKRCLDCLSACSAVG
jgi:4-aminobutyrate aminotransferase-like enzyme